MEEHESGGRVDNGEGRGEAEMVVALMLSPQQPVSVGCHNVTGQVLFERFKELEG